MCNNRNPASNVVTSESPASATSEDIFRFLCAWISVYAVLLSASVPQQQSSWNHREMAECHRASLAQSCRALHHTFTTPLQCIWSSYSKILFNQAPSQMTLWWGPTSCGHLLNFGWWASGHKISVPHSGTRGEHELVFCNFEIIFRMSTCFPEWRRDLRRKWSVRDVIFHTDLSLSLSLSVFQVSFICVWVFAACRRTEISTDLPVRGKKFFQFDLLFMKDESDSSSIVWPGMEFTL